MSSVDIRLSANGVEDGYSRGARPIDVITAGSFPSPEPFARDGASLGVKGSLLPSLPGDGHAGRRHSILGYEKSRGERLAHIHAILLEVGNALPGEKGIVDQEI